MAEIRHCVIPAAGLGTRFLPQTKAVPKELLPVIDRPLIQWGVEEAVAAGATEIVFVLSQGKEQIARHFTREPELEALLEKRNKIAELEAIRKPERLANFSFVYQTRPDGLGDAVLCAEHVVGDNPFFCLLPDDLSYAKPPVLAQLGAAHRETGSTVLALMRVTPEQISRYGCADISTANGRLHKIRGLVEKPDPKEAKSDLAVMGRYVLPPHIFDALRRTKPGAGGEIQLTDGVAELLKERDVWGLEFEGELLDVGTPQGWLRTNLRLAEEISPAKVPQR